MEVLYVVVPLALSFAGFAALAFVWCVEHNQYDDQKGTAQKVLLDDE